MVTNFVTSFILNTRLQAIQFFHQFVATRYYETPVTLTIRNIVLVYTPLTFNTQKLCSEYLRVSCDSLTKDGCFNERH